MKVWLAPATIVAVVGDTLNCAASVPDRVMPDTLSVALPRFVTVKVVLPDDPVLTVPALTVRKKGDQEGR